MGYPAGQRAPGIFSSLPPGVEISHAMPPSLAVFMGLELGPHVHEANTSLEPSILSTPTPALSWQILKAPQGWLCTVTRPSDKFLISNHMKQNHRCTKFVVNSLGIGMRGRHYRHVQDAIIPVESLGTLYCKLHSRLLQKALRRPESVEGCSGQRSTDLPPNRAYVFVYVHESEEMRKTCWSFTQ